MKNKRNAISAVFTVFAVLAVLVGSLTACNGAPDVEELLPRVTELVTASCGLDKALYGDGLPVYAESYTGTDYAYVDSQQSEYDTAEELRTAILAVYTASYAEQIIEAALVGATNEAGSVLPRFTEDENGSLMQHKATESILPGDREFLFDTLTVEKASGKTVVVRIKTMLDGKKDDDARLVLRLENGVWLLDSPTY